MIQGGDFTDGNGRGVSTTSTEWKTIRFIAGGAVNSPQGIVFRSIPQGESIYGGKFDDENFTLKHEGPMYLSMANGKDSHAHQFYAVVISAPFFDTFIISFSHLSM